VNDDVIQALEDERMVSYVPLLVLSEEVYFSLIPTLLPVGEGSPLALRERAGVRESLLMGG
jgi:hypothetical protein